MRFYIKPEDGKRATTAGCTIDITATHCQEAALPRVFSNYSFRVRSILAVFSLVLLMVSYAQSQTSSPELTPSDMLAVRAADSAYANAWLSNDSANIMSVLTSIAVVVPSGMMPIEGPDRIAAFWFPPDSPPTVVTRFELSQRQWGGSGHMGYVRGSFTLEFEYDGTSYNTGGVYLALFEKQGDGQWLMSQRIWNDHPSE